MVRGRKFVRFETFTPFGTTAALYVSNGETEPALLIPSKKLIFMAKHPETLVREVLGINLPVDLFQYVLSACVPPERFGLMTGRSEAGVVQLVSRSGGNYFDWQVSATPPALRGLSVNSSEFEGRVLYDPPVGLTKEAVPGKIRIFSKGWSMEVAVEELKPAPQFQPWAFYVPDLPDVRKVDLDKMK